MKAKLSLLPLLTLTSTRIGALAAQASPTTQPAYLTIVREEVKLGRGAEHTRIEAGWPAAFAKAKSPSSYLALASLTGQDEVWFTIPFASNAAVAEEFKRQDADPVLSAELARLARADAEVLTGHTVVQAVARPDLTIGAFPDVAKQRFWQITTFRVKPGHRPDFEAAAKAYGAAAQRAEPKTSYRVYELIAGAPGPTFFIFSSVESYGQFDDLRAAGDKTAQGFTAEERATLQKFSAEGLLSSETNRFRLDPAMSYVSPETRAQDPAFWIPKKPIARATTQP